MAAGDIAIIGFAADNQLNTTTTKTFTFVLLANLGSQTITFTDSGWFAAGGFRSGEGTISVTIPAGMPIGTVITLSNVNSAGVTATASNGAALTATRSGSFDFNGSGDQLFAYTGTATAPSFLYGLDFADGNTTYAGDATSATTSAVPTGLTFGSTAIAFGADNGRYNGPTSGSRTELLAAIADATKWQFSEDTQFSPIASSFMVGTGSPGSFSIGDVSVLEGTGTPNDIVFVVTRPSSSTGTVSVTYTVNPGSTAGDFTYGAFAQTGTLTFGEGEFTKEIRLQTVADATPELDETFSITLSNPTGGATISRATATGTIQNDDGPPIQVAIDSVRAFEGDSGTTVLTFTVTRTGSTAAFDVSYATADRTATAGSDYVATSGTLSFAAGDLTKTIAVTVNGDTVREAVETFAVTLSGATNDAVVTTATGTGTILSDDLTLISAIQGNSYFSPIVAGAGITGYGTGASTTVNATSFTVTVRAVVTALDGVGARQGFYITEEGADWDASNLTSEGIFVMTATDTAGVGVPLASAVPGLQVGQIVTVTANVMEYRPFNTNAPLTVLVNPVVTLGATGQALPTLTLDGAFKIPNALLSGVAPDFTDSVDDAGDSFDATNYAASFFETIEGMLVNVPDVRVADGFTAAQGGGVNFKVYSGASANPEQINSRGGYTIGGDPALSPPDTASTLDNVIAGGRGLTDGDINPDILEIDFSDFALATPGYVTDGRLSMGDGLGNVTGIVEWNFTDMKLFPTAVGTFVDTVLTKETTALGTDPRALTFATFNVENLAGNALQARFDAIAQVVASNLGAPAILSIEEIQDNNGTTNDGTTDASTTWSRLVAAVNTATGRVYQWVDQPPVNNAEGGATGGNIRVGFLYDTGRVQLGNLAADAPIEERRKWVDRLGDNARDAGDLIAISDNMVSGINTSDYTSTRLSLLGQFTFNGNTIFALANHLPSKGGSGTFWDASQIDPQNGTPINSGWAQRVAMGEDIFTLLNYAQTQVPGARILSGGDYNDFYFYRPLEAAAGYVFADGTSRNDGARLVNLALALPEAERYTYTFDGRSQAIDHILADAATAAVATTDVVHINSGFSAGNRISDHDPVLTSIDLRSFGEVLIGTINADTIDGGGGDDVIDGRGGADTMIGGLGNDVFFVDDLNDVVTEFAGEGTDEIRTTLANYVLPANVERLTLLGAAGGGSQSVSGNAGDNVLTGGTAADVINIAQGGADTVGAGGGDDGIFVGAALDAADRIDGGAGTLDQIGLQGDYTTQVVLGADTVRGVEMLVFLAGNDTRFGAPGTATYTYNIKSNDAMVAAGQQFVVQGNALTAGETLIFDGSSELDGSFLTYGSFGNDILTGGAQDDGFYFGQGRFTAGDRIDGRGGFMDQVGLQGDFAGANALTFGASQLANIEMIVLLSGADTRFGGGASRFSYTLTMNDANATTFMTVQANTLRDGEVLVLDASAERETSYRVYGGQSADTIIGGAAPDQLWGLRGADTLTGGGDNDSFIYQSVADSTASARDTITDFTRGDRIDVFLLNITRFVEGGFAADGSGQIRATAAGGGNWLIEGDADGNGAADLTILVNANAGFTWNASDFRLFNPGDIDSINPNVAGDSFALIA